MLQPNNPTIYAAIGMTYHQSGCLEKAIENYHQSLGLNVCVWCIDINIEFYQNKLSSYSQSEGNRDVEDLLQLAVQEWSEFEEHLFQ